MTQLPPRLYADLIGRPFLVDGRGPYAYDCVGLAIEIQTRRGFALPTYLSDPRELHRQMAEGGVLSEPQRLESPEAGCVVLCRMVGGQMHLGTMLDAYRILHTSAQTERAVIERILDRLWQRRIVGFYRMEAAR